ncbi:MAG: rod shape-determining protein MreC, partial [Cyanobacteria bacterium J06659_2]
MFAVRRWWGLYARRAGLITLALGMAWLVRETQGAAIYEAYQWLARPLQPGLTKPEQLENAYVLELQERIVELENQNQNLQSLVEYRDAQTEPGIVAAVIGRSANHWWQQVTLGKGSNAGIE